MYINLYDKFRGEWDAYKKAVMLIDEMIDLSEDDDEKIVLEKVRENLQDEADGARDVYDEWRDKRSVDPFAPRRRKQYGRMHGCEESLEFVRALPESEQRNWTIRRMEYEFDKERQIKPTFRKGVYGKKYDSYACGNCGEGSIERMFNYCPNCGFAIGWEIMYEPDEEQDAGEAEQQTIFDFIGSGENGNP